MARTINLSISPGKTHALLRDLRAIKSHFSIQVLWGVSVEPTGDVISFTIPNFAARQ